MKTGLWSVVRWVVIVGWLAWAELADAASGTWLGTTDGTWATGSNWSAAAAPGAGETATFSGDGNGNTAIDIGSGVTVGALALIFGAAPYSFNGSGGLTATAAITMGANNNQTFNVPFTAPYINEYNLANNGAGDLIFNNTYGFSASRRANFSGTGGNIYLNGGTVNAEWCRKLGPNTLFVSNNVQFQYEMTFCEGTVNYNATNLNSTSYAYFIVGDQANKKAVFNMNGGWLERQLETGTGWAGRYNPVSVGHATSSTGVVNQAGGFMNILGSAYLGFGSGAVGEYRMTGGSAYVRNDVVVGNGANSVGLVDISGGNFWDQYWVKIGNNASALATWTQSGGVVTGGHFRVGAIDNARAALYLNGGRMDVYHWNCSNYGRLHVGAATGSKGGLIVTDGMLTATMVSVFGAGANSYGGLLQSGGLLALQSEVQVGGLGVASALGVWDISGGDVTMRDWFLLGRGTGNNAGVVTVRDTGRVTVADNALNRMVFAFSYQGPTTSTNVFTVADGGQFLGPASSSYYLNIAEMNNTGILGALNLNSGGRFRISRIEASANPTAVINFNGGTLQASIDSADFLTDVDIDAVTVYGAGGTLDNNGKTITVGRPLAAAADDGVTAVAVTGAGAGYVGAPAVYFIGGAGIPATAYAVMEPDSVGSKTYKVKEIRVSSPGRYTSAPTSAVLLGGGPTTAATLGAVSLAANASGGMTFTGGGKTVLTGASTYTGETLVNAGTLQLDGSLAAGSAVTVASGAKLTGAGTAAGPVVIADGGIFASLSSASKLTVGALSFEGAATLNLRVGGGSETLTVTGALVTAPAYGQVTVNIVEGPILWENGSTNILLRFGSFGGSASDFSLGAIPGLGARQAASLAIDNNALVLVITGDMPYWSGEYSADWTTATLDEPKNWRLNLSGTAVDFLNNDAVVFDDRAAANSTVNIAQNVSPVSMIFNNNTNDYALVSAGGFGITSGFLVKNGEGALTIATGNSYTNGTTLNTGTLNINHAAALGNTAAGELVINGGRLDNTSGAPITTTAAKAQKWAADFTFAGTSDLNFNGGAVTLTGGVTRTVNVAAGTLAVGSLTSAGTGLTKEGAGALALGAAISSIGGPLTVNAGKVQIGINDLIATGLGGSGTVENGSATTRWLYINNGSDNTFPGLLQNGGAAGLGLCKLGAAMLTLTATNTYSDRTTVRDGTLRISYLADVGTPCNIGVGSVGSSSLYLGDQAAAGKLLYTGPDATVNRGFTVSASAGYSGIFELESRLTFTGPIAAANTGGFIKRGAGTLTLSNAGAAQKLSNGGNGGTLVFGANIANGKLALKNGTFTAGGETVVGGQLLTGGNYTAAALDITDGATFNLANWFSISRANGTSGLSSVVTVNNGALYQSNPSMGLAMGYWNNLAGLNVRPVLTLRGTSVASVAGVLYCGESAGADAQINVQDASTLILANDTLANKRIGVGGKGTLNISGGAVYSGNGLTLGSVAGSIGVVNLKGGVLEAGALVKAADASAIVNFNGGTLRANTNATALLTGLTAANVYAGGAVIDVQSFAVTIGQPLLAAVNAFGVTGVSGIADATVYTVTPVATFSAPESGTDVAAGYALLNADGTLAGVAVSHPGSGYSAAPTLSLNGAPVAAMVSLGPVAGGGLTLKGTTGTNTLTGASTYTGATAVEGGTLMLNGSLASSALTVASGAALAGSGSAAGAAATVFAGGRVAPGANGIGTLTLGSLDLKAGAKLAIDVAADGTCDKVICSGALALDGLSTDDVAFNTPGDVEKGVYVLVDAASVSGTLGSPIAVELVPGLKWIRLALDNANGDLLMIVRGRGTLISLR